MNKGTILFLIPLTFSLIGLGGCAGLLDEPSARNGGGYVVPPAPIGGNSSGVLDGYGNPAPELQDHRMMQDPEENLTDDTIEVKATVKDQAERECERLASQRSEGSTIVKCLGCTIRTRTTGKYLCTFRIETAPSTSEETNSEGQL